MYELATEEVNPQRKATEFIGSIGKAIYSLIETILVALVLAIVLYLFIMTPHEVVGNSMHPTYKNGEFLMANKITYRISEPKRGDVIIFKFSDTQDFIKRVIGIPGDEVMIKDGKIYINGEMLDESNYLSSSVITNGGEYLHEGQSITIEQGKYFVCGDNRTNSSDSRVFGPIEKEAIKGKAWIVYFPFSEFRIVQHESY
ncbi:signal peptidase I [Candidatus Dojkabacteria bacterium]|uniref:Signal peptidase I n=1 Tax=Candidatus Dojkabacteria bacterium TaxID=2099670 RepID=A0A847ETQ9_9BACT|nr:signal peptidase I [Candidatus Dojkabacteria bacterium]HRX43639.1 signal peptidase I [Candidatus Dojkabacteria bacterium]